LIGHRTIQLSVILSFLLLSGCSQNVINTDNFEKNYDFDVYDHIKVASWVEEENTLKEVIKSFQDRYPHVDVEIVNFPSQTYDDYFDVMTDPLEDFDVILLSGGFYSTLVENDIYVN
jgi:ABC-type glycerol-3-phosphate transport system substrate-binding protein